MPKLDRIVTVRIAIEARNDFGEVAELVREYRRWATRMDKSLVDILEAGGDRDEAARTYRVRWFAALAGEPVSTVAVIDGDLVFNARNLVETRGTDRRRYLDIEGVAPLYPPAREPVRTVVDDSILTLHGRPLTVGSRD